jgi:ankyrin repeat protein
MCEQGYYERAESLVKCGADLEAKDIFGRTPLRAVGGNSSTEIVGMLVSYGAKPNAPALNGTTLFDVAVYEGNVELCDYLTAIDKVLLREIKNNIQNTGHSVFKI